VETLVINLVFLYAWLSIIQRLQEELKKNPGSRPFEEVRACHQLCYILQASSDSGQK
jgi:hypothetical protein